MKPMKDTSHMKRQACPMYELADSHSEIYVKFVSSSRGRLTLTQWRQNALLYRMYSLLEFSDTHPMSNCVIVSKAARCGTDSPTGSFWACSVPVPLLAMSVCVDLSWHIWLIGCKLEGHDAYYRLPADGHSLCWSLIHARKPYKLIMIIIIFIFMTDEFDQWVWYSSCARFIDKLAHIFYTCPAHCLCRSGYW